MGIDIKGFKVIYRNQVFNAINVMPNMGGYNPDRPGATRPKSLEVWYINEDGELIMIHDDSSEFKFVKA